MSKLVGYYTCIRPEGCPKHALIPGCLGFCGHDAPDALRYSFPMPTPVAVRNHDGEIQITFHDPKERLWVDPLRTARKDEGQP